VDVPNKISGDAAPGSITARENGDYRQSGDLYRLMENRLSGFGSFFAISRVAREGSR
jgi:hypothetical protein